MECPRKVFPAFVIGSHIFSELGDTSKILGIPCNRSLIFGKIFQDIWGASYINPFSPKDKKYLMTKNYILFFSGQIEILFGGK